jgi:putative SOS response-associated peptidase YedK
MCGRYVLTAPTQLLLQLFELPEAPELAPRYNVAPTQPVATVIARSTGRRLVMMRWGLIPPWATDPASGPTPINARADTASEKPAFRAAFRRHRCLVPADAFYEWRQEADGKQPMCFRLKDGAPFAFAGLYELWKGPDGKTVPSCTILTTEPNELVAPIHDRMPAIVPHEAYATWLDPTLTEPSAVQGILAPYPAEAMTVFPVSKRVGSPRVDEPSLIEPLSHPEGQLKLF